MNFFEYMAYSWDHVLELAIGHAVVVAISLAIAVVIGVGLGVLVYRRERLANLVLGITSIFLTIPSLALFGVFIPIFGLGYLPSVVALVMYALLPILRNTVTGLQSVDPAVAESAQGMGMSARERLWRIELPLAWPVLSRAGNRRQSAHGGLFSHPSASADRAPRSAGTHNPAFRASAPASAPICGSTQASALRQQPARPSHKKPRR